MEGATESGYSIGGIIVEGKLSCVLYSIVIVNCGYTLLLLINRGGGGGLIGNVMGPNLKWRVLIYASQVSLESNFIFNCMMCC